MADFFGTNGNDVLVGGAGADTLTGGLGNDIYIVNDPGDAVIEGENAGIDRVETNLSTYDLPAHVENLEYTGVGSFGGTGNALANIIVGGSLTDGLTGLEGDDTLGGEGGDDLLDGGDGNDRLVGGTGNDLMFGGAGNDLMVVNVVGDIANGGDGIDTVHFVTSVFANYVAQADVENFRSLNVFVNLTMNALDNIFTGGADQDLVNGGDGNDIMYGLGAADPMNGQGGNDTLYGGDGNDQLSGGDGNDRIYGGNDRDDISAGSGDDVVYGEAGDDRIIGGAGIDIMHGGAGADRFDFNSILETGSTLATSDRILDFNRAQGDFIVLFGIDANTTVTGNDAFSFIGTAAFSAAGQLRYEVANGRTVVSGDVNGDGVADFFIRLDGVQTLTSDVFTL